MRSRSWKAAQNKTKLLDARPTMLLGIDQRHHDEPIERVFGRLEALGYHLFAVRPGGLTPLADYDVEADQTDHLGARRPESGEPADYVKEFVLSPDGPHAVEKLLARLKKDER